MCFSRGRKTKSFDISRSFLRISSASARLEIFSFRNDMISYPWLRMIQNWHPSMTSRKIVATTIDIWNIFFLFISVLTELFLLSCVEIIKNPRNEHKRHEHEEPQDKIPYNLPDYFSFHGVSFSCV